MRLGVIADDYTGASDLAGVLSAAGLRTVQTVGVPSGLPADELHDADAVVVALKSRSIEPARAVSLSLGALEFLRAGGATHILFKICSTFDSTDRGNIGPVLDALREATGSATAAVNPSFIETGRSLYRGHLFVGDVLLSDSPLKDHPLNPMNDPNLVRVLARQSTSPVVLVPLATVEAGAGAIRAALDDAARAGAGAAIVDSVLARHLDTLGEAVLDRPLSCGASGLGGGLARAIVAAGNATRDPAEHPPSPRDRRAAILAGSCSAATLKQIERAATFMPVHRIDVAALLDRADEVARALEWATPRLADGPVLIATSAPAEERRALQSRVGAGAEHLGERLEAALADIAERLVAGGLGRLIVAGGETSGAVVDRLGLQAFRIGREIAPGVPALHTLGQRHAGMALALKSGNFGGEDFFRSALAILDGETL